MRKLLFAAIVGGTAIIANAQMQVNPQLGLTWQNLTAPAGHASFSGAAGYTFGADLRIGKRIFFQPGAFLDRNTTVVSYDDGNSVQFQDNIIRTDLKLKALAGYRIIDTYQFDLRFVAGPTYDVLLSADNKDGRITWNKGDFNSGSFNVHAGLGFDMGYFTLEPSVSYGLSRAFSDAGTVKDFGGKYLTYGLTLGVNFGDDDK